MLKLLDKNPNSKQFWDIQYAPERQKAYLASNLMRPKYEKALEYVKRGDKVCDMACGFGVFASLTKEKYPQNRVYAFDMSDLVLKLKNESPNIKWIQAKIGEEEIGTGFDVVFAGDVIEHLDDPVCVFVDANRLLKKGGLLIITTPDGDVRPYAGSADHVWLFDHEDVDKFYLDSGFEQPGYPYIEGVAGVLFITATGRKK